MKLKLFRNLALTAVFSVVMAASAFAQVSYQQVRNATGKITYNHTTFLVDPMLAEKGRYPGFQDCFNPEIRNPRVDLPFSKDEVMKGVDAVIITHTHLDHWDEVAQQFINKDLPLFVQDEADAAAIRKEGFKNVTVMGENTQFKGVTLTRIQGQHGTNEMYDNKAAALSLGNTMGIVFREKGEKTTYVMGDTLWTPAVSRALYIYNPDILVMNTGYAKALNYDDGIIMGTEDVGKACRVMPKAKIITVHMDAINHCTVDRKNMRNYVNQNHLDKQVAIPADGETIQL